MATAGGQAGGPGIRSLARVVPPLRDSNEARGQAHLACQHFGLNAVAANPPLWQPRMGPTPGHPIHQPNKVRGAPDSNCESNTGARVFGVKDPFAALKSRQREAAFWQSGRIVFDLTRRQWCRPGHR
jgi:hypothetical protein